MSEEMKECPNCGHIPTPYDWCSASDGWRGQAYCEKCDMRGPAVLGDRQAFVDAWNAMPRRLRWTREKPTVPEFYWYKTDGGVREIGIVFGSGSNTLFVHFAGEEDAHLLELVDGWWAGPIPEPEDAE